MSILAIYIMPRGSKYPENVSLPGYIKIIFIVPGLFTEGRVEGGL